jgi:DNA-binding transcriptional LysR family regulator
MVRYQMVLAGAGWAHLPRAWVAADLAAARLVELRYDKNALPPSHAMRAFYRISAPPGPAGRWLLDRVCKAALPQPTATPRKPRRRRRE